MALFLGVWLCACAGPISEDRFVEKGIVGEYPETGEISFYGTYEPTLTRAQYFGQFVFTMLIKEQLEPEGPVVCIVIPITEKQFAIQSEFMERTKGVDVVDTYVKGYLVDAAEVETVNDKIIDVAGVLGDKSGCEGEETFLRVTEVDPYTVIHHN